MKLSVRIVFHSLTANAGAQDGEALEGGGTTRKCGTFSMAADNSVPNFICFCMCFAVSFFLPRCRFPSPADTAAAA